MSTISPISPSPCLPIKNACNNHWGKRDMPNSEKRQNPNLITNEAIHSNANN